MPGAKLTHTTSWRASVFVGVFPSQLWPNLAVLLIKSDKISAWGGEDCWEMLLRPCDTWLGQEPGVQNLQKAPLVLWECKHQQHPSAQPRPLPTRAPQRQEDNGGAFTCNSKFYSPETFLKLRCQMSPWEVSAGSCDVQIRVARGAGRLQERRYWASSFPLGGSVKTYKSIQSHCVHFPLLKSLKPCWWKIWGPLFLLCQSTFHMNGEQLDK